MSEQELQDYLSAQGLMLDPGTGQAVAAPSRSPDSLLLDYRNAHRQVTARIGYGGFTPEMARHELWVYRTRLLTENPGIASQLAAAIPDPAAEVFQNDRAGNAQGYTDAGLMNNRVGATANARFRIQQSGYILDNQTGALFSGLAQMPPELKAAYDTEQRALGLTAPYVPPGSPSSSTPPGSSPPGALNTLNPGGAPVGTQAPTPPVIPAPTVVAATPTPVTPSIPSPVAQPSPDPAQPQPAVTPSPAAPATPSIPRPQPWAAPDDAGARLPVPRLPQPATPVPQPVNAQMSPLELYLNMTGRNAGAGASAQAGAQSAAAEGGMYRPAVEPPRPYADVEGPTLPPPQPYSGQGEYAEAAYRRPGALGLQQTDYATWADASAAGAGAAIARPLPYAADVMPAGVGAIPRPVPAPNGIPRPTFAPDYEGGEEYTAQVQPAGSGGGGKYRPLSIPDGPAIADDDTKKPPVNPGGTTGSGTAGGTGSVPSSNPPAGPKGGDTTFETRPDGTVVVKEWVIDVYGKGEWKVKDIRYPAAGPAPRDAAAIAQDVAAAGAAARNAETAAKDAETRAQLAANDTAKTPAEIAQLEATAARLRAEANRIATLLPVEVAKGTAETAQTAAQTDRITKLLPHEIDAMIANTGLTTAQANRLKTLLEGEVNIQNATVAQIRAGIENAAKQMGLDTSKFDWQKITDSAKLTQSGQQQEIDRAKQVEDHAIAQGRLKLDADLGYAGSERADLLAGGQLAGLTGYYGGAATLDREKAAADADRANMLAQADVADRAAQVALKMGDQKEAQRQFDLSQRLRQQAQDSSESQFQQTFGLQEKTQLGSLDLERAKFAAQQRAAPASYLDIVYAQRGGVPQQQAPDPFSFITPTATQGQGIPVPQGYAAQGQGQGVPVADVIRPTAVAAPGQGIPRPTVEQPPAASTGKVGGATYTGGVFGSGSGAGSSMSAPTSSASLNIPRPLTFGEIDSSGAQLPGLKSAFGSGDAGSVQTAGGVPYLSMQRFNALTSTERKGLDAMLQSTGNDPETYLEQTRKLSQTGNVPARFETRQIARPRGLYAA